VRRVSVSFDRALIYLLSPLSIPTNIPRERRWDT
jgi:hypothetical protein